MYMHICMCGGCMCVVWVCILQPLSSQDLRYNWREKTHKENSCVVHSMVVSLRGLWGVHLEGVFLKQLMLYSDEVRGRKGIVQMVK